MPSLELKSAGASELLRRGGFLGRDTEACPHDGARQSNAILVRGFRRDMVLCPECLRTFQEITAGYRSRMLGPAEVVARLRALGYSRGDAARFVLELVAERLRVPLGFRRWLL